MLKHLFIKNYAIIQDLELDLSKGFTVITGETGAGKSILIGAINLVLGERADSKVLLDKENKAIIEVRLDIRKNKEVLKYLEQTGFDTDNELILRRELLPSGKSRAFINDTPCKLQQLKTIRPLIIDLHRQFDTLELQSESIQLNYLDLFAQQQVEIKNYQKEYLLLLKTKKEIQHIENTLSAHNKEKDYLQFVLNEISDLKLSENELESLESENTLLENAQEIKDSLAAAVNVLSNQEYSVLDQLNLIIHSIQATGKDIPAIETILNRARSVYEELKDLSSEIENIEENTEANPEKLQILSERLAEGNRILQKHNLSSTNELLAFQSEIINKLDQIECSDEKLHTLKAIRAKQKKQVKKIADTISAQRNKAAADFAHEIMLNLSDVGMPDAQLKITLEKKSLSQTGQDEIKMLFDANKTENYLPIEKVASGGELSRLMLCIKYILAQSNQMPCMIFDEIDTGISGDIAKKVANKFATLGQSNQLISISHLPQIAAKAHQHLFVFKEKGRNSFSTSSIKKLSDTERVEVLAIMLSGNNPSETARAAALELMLTD